MTLLKACRAKVMEIREQIHIINDRRNGVYHIAEAFKGDTFTIQWE